MNASNPPIPSIPVPSLCRPLPVPFIMFSDDIYPPSKDYIPQPLYVRQPCSLQIIQLVECSPPPPQQKYTPSRISSSSYSDSDSDASAYDSSSSSLSAGSSYCSSAAAADDSASSPVPPSFDNRDPSIDDTYRIRQRRVSVWRDAVYSKNDAHSGPSIARAVIFFTVLLTYLSNNAARPASPSQKRKTPDGDLASSDSVVSFFPIRELLSLSIPFHRRTSPSPHRPPTPHHASPLARRSARILVPLATRTFRPPTVSSNTLLRAEMPAKHVASPSSTGLSKSIYSLPSPHPSGN